MVPLPGPGVHRSISLDSPPSLSLASLFRAVGFPVILGDTVCVPAFVVAPPLAYRWVMGRVCLLQTAVI